MTSSHVGLFTSNEGQLDIEWCLLLRFCLQRLKTEYFLFNTNSIQVLHRDTNVPVTLCSIWQKVTTNNKAYPSEHILTSSLIGKIHILFVNHIHFLHTNELRSWCDSERKETKEFNDINKRCRVRTATIHDGPVVLDRDGPVVLKFIYGHLYVFLSVTTDCVRHWRIIVIMTSPGKLYLSEWWTCSYHCNTFIWSNGSDLYNF